MYNLIWSRDGLTPIKIGAFCEYYAKMVLSSYGFTVYSAEIDDHGIDFIAETPANKRFLKFQVKSFREKTNYVFMRESTFDIKDTSLYLILIKLIDGEHPILYFIPSSAWKKENNEKPFVYHDYEGKKSAPEYGINLSPPNIPLLEKYLFEKMIGDMAD